MAKKIDSKSNNLPTKTVIQYRNPQQVASMFK